MTAAPAYRTAVTFRALALAVLVALASCAGAREPSAVAAPSGTPQRIVSLVPSMTEDLFAVGAGDKVVGVSSYTDYPPQARNLPIVASFGPQTRGQEVDDLALVLDHEGRLACHVVKPPAGVLRDRPSRRHAG